MRRTAFLTLLLVSVARPGAAIASEDCNAVCPAMAIITAVVPVRAEITRKIETSNALAHAGEGLSLPNLPERDRRDGLESGHITSAGTIIGYNSKHGVLVVLEPILERGKAEWRCKVLPAVAAPKACR